MGYVSVEVDIDLDDIDDYDLFNEIGKRVKQARNNSRKKELTELVEEHLQMNPAQKYNVEIKTLDDEMRMDVLMESFSRYSLTELENRLKI